VTGGDGKVERYAYRHPILFIFFFFVYNCAGEIIVDFSIHSLMDLLPDVFLPANADGIQAVINFELSGEAGGDWAVTIHDQKCVVQPLKDTNPDLTLVAKAEDILDIFSGRLDPMRALLLGKLKMTGNMNLAMRLA